jgi:hypothetical protein
MATAKQKVCRRLGRKSIEGTVDETMASRLNRTGKISEPTVAAIS